MKTIYIPKQLNNLQKLLFDYAPIYIVGGYNRQYFLGENLKNTDIDICGKIQIEELKSILDKKYNVLIINKALGTVLISKGKFKCEYTCFRQEEYFDGGEHKPKKVAFVDELELDAERRDFSINAIYYDLKEKKFIDMFNGIQDINNKTIRCITLPDYVFSKDGLRILRMIRFVGVLNFDIDYNTYSVAKNYIHQLKDISNDRKKMELQKIVHSKHASKALLLISKLSIWKYLLNDDYNLTFNSNYFELVERVKSKKIVFGVLLFNLIKEKFCEDYISKINKITFFNKKEREHILLLVKALEFSKKMKVNNFIIGFGEIIEELAVFDEMKEFVHSYYQLKAKKLPVRKNLLNIDGRDIIKYTNFKGKEISEAIKKIQRFALENCIYKRKALLKLVKKLNEGEKI